MGYFYTLWERSRIHYNSFAGTNSKIAYRTSNTTEKKKKTLVYNRREINVFSRSGIWPLTSPVCGKKCTGQNGRSFHKWYNEHLQSLNIRTQIRHLQNTYTILDTHLASWNVTWIYYSLPRQGNL